MNNWVKYQEEDYSSKDSEITEASLLTDRIKKSLRFINPNDIVLDLGCNNGLVSNVIFNMECEVIGVDLPKVIKIAKVKFPYIKFLSFNLNSSFPFEDNYFDCIMAGEIIKHIIDDEKFLKECHRVLKDNGKLIITTPNIAYIRNRMLLLLGRYVDVETYMHLYAFRNLKRKMAKTGFKKIIEKGAVYDPEMSNFASNFLARFKYGYQNPLWYFLECLLPKKFKNTIVMVAIK